MKDTGCDIDTLKAPDKLFILITNRYPTLYTLQTNLPESWPPTSSWWSRWRPQCWCRSWCPQCRWRRRWQRRSTCLSAQNYKNASSLEIWQICNCHFTNPQSALQLAVQAWPAQAEVHLNWEKNPHTIVLRKTYIQSYQGYLKRISELFLAQTGYGPRHLRSWSISSLVWF